MSYKLLLVFGVHLLFSLSSGKPIPAGDLWAEDVRFAGSADGKAFFSVSNGTRTNWVDARQACKQMNMILAELTSPAQVNAVKSSPESAQIENILHWVGGRDAGLPRQFSWDQSNIDVSLAGAGVTGLPSIRNTCLRFYPSSSLFYYTTCADTNTHRLCEVSTSKLSQRLEEIIVNSEKL